MTEGWEGMKWRKEPAAAPPSQIKARLAEVRSVSEGLAVNYRELFLAAHERISRESVKVKGATADPTADIATNGLQAGLRRTCSEIDRRIDRAYANLESALRLSAVALDRLDPPDIPVAIDVRRVTEAQLEEALEAQQRRNSG